MCGVFLCLCLQIKPYPLRWTVVSECVVLVQCCKGIWQIAPLHPPLSPPSVCFVSWLHFRSTDLCKGAHDGFLLVILKVPYCANLNLPIMCFWPVSECPRNEQTNQKNNNLILSHCTASEYLPECMNVMLQRRLTTPQG